MCPQTASRLAPPPHQFAILELSPASPQVAIAAARELLLEYGSFVRERPEITTFCYGALAEEAAALPHSFIAQGGGCLIASLGPDPLGFIAWRSLALDKNSLADLIENAWEIKRLWVRPATRGTGLGRTLIDEIIRRARAAGKARLLLDTAPQVMPAAHHLYLELGFRECPSYNGSNPSGIVFMSRDVS